MALLLEALRLFNKEVNVDCKTEVINMCNLKP